MIRTWTVAYVATPSEEHRRVIVSDDAVVELVDGEHLRGDELAVGHVVGRECRMRVLSVQHRLTTEDAHAA
jgi:hypothetical protein